jgi:uncharacterized protein involved in exopolysaccharide biosynthesis
MISLRLAVPAVLVAAAVAGCLTYFVASPSPEADVQLLPTFPKVKGSDTGTPVNIDQHPTPEEDAAAAFTRASKMILRRLPDLQASARTNELPIAGHIPLPRRRPIGAPP